MTPPLFQTQRTRLLDVYKKAGQPFLACTTPYHSVQTLTFDIVKLDNSTSVGVAFAVARAGQRMSFFSYGVGDRVTLGNNENVQATEAETNLAKGKSTNGASDFVIEGVGLSCRSMAIEYASDTSILVVSPDDEDVEDAMFGKTGMYDPASILFCPQVGSPQNGENGMFQSLLPLLSVEFEWDRKRTEKLGVCDLFPHGGGSSYLRANGVPDSDNVYRIPEGYVWRRDGEPDGEFMAHLRLEHSLVVPLSLRSLITTATAFVVPESITMDVMMRLYGLEVQLPSQN